MCYTMNLGAAISAIGEKCTKINDILGGLSIDYNDEENKYFVRPIQSVNKEELQIQTLPLALTSTPKKSPSNDHSKTNSSTLSTWMSKESCFPRAIHFAN